MEIILICVVVTGFLIAGELLTSKNIAGVIPFLISMLILLWIIISATSTDWRYKEVKAMVMTSNSRDIVIMDDNLINLNAKFGRRFEPGQEITIMVAQRGWYGGIYWIPGSDQLYSLGE